MCIYSASTMQDFGVRVINKGTIFFFSHGVYNLVEEKVIFEII